MPKNERVEYDTEAGQVSYAFAPLADIIRTIKQPLADNGLSYRFEFDQSTDSLTVVCVITHRDGHSERTAMSAPADTSGSKNTVQARGSTTTYLERYTIMGALGIATGDTDDDGQQARPTEPPETKYAKGEQRWLDLAPDDPVPSGKHKDDLVRDLPAMYLKSLGEKNHLFREFCKRELDRRIKGEPSEQPRAGWKVPELRLMTADMNPSTVTALLHDRYGKDKPAAITKSQQEDLLAFLQAESATRAIYSNDSGRAKSIMQARFGKQAEYRKLEATQMEELGSVLEKIMTIETARAQIPDKFDALVDDWENATGEKLETASAKQHQQLIDTLRSNGFKG
jgi:hypothetical protein